MPRPAVRLDAVRQTLDSRDEAPEQQDQVEDDRNE